MKDFDLYAAMEGAKLRTMDGRPVRILCFNLRDKYPIIAAILYPDGIERVYGYDLTGMLKPNMEIPNWLDYRIMMADDDYIEKLERGEYDKPSTSDNVASASESKPNSDPWDEFKRQSALAMIQASAGGIIVLSDIAQILKNVNALTDGLKNM